MVETPKWYEGIEFNQNKVREPQDEKEIKFIFENYKKWPIVEWSDGLTYYSFSNSTETIFVSTERIDYFRSNPNKQLEKAWNKMTKLELGVLQSQTETSITAVTYNSEKEAQEYVNTLEQNNLLKVVNIYLKKYKDLSKWIVGAEWNDDDREWLEDTLRDNVKTLRRIKRDLKKAERKWRQYEDLTIHKSRLWELIYYYPHYGKVRQAIVQWIYTSWIHQIIDSLKDARRAKWYEKKAAKHQKKMNDILMDGAILASQNRNGERLEENLEASINWGPMPIQVTQTTNWYTYTNSGGTIQTASSWRRICRPKWLKWFHRSFGERFSNMLDQAFPNWMKDPRQKEAWTNIWSLLAIWWAIFTWYKTIKSLQKQDENWKKDKNWERKRWEAAAWWTAFAAILGNDMVIQTFEDARNLHPAEKTRITTDLTTNYSLNQKDAEQLATMPLATLSALNFLPIYELTEKQILQKSNSWVSFNDSNFEKAILSNPNLTNEQKQIYLNAWKKINNWNSANLAFQAFNLSYDDLVRIGSNDHLATLSQLDQVNDWFNDPKKFEVCPELFKQWLSPKDLTSLKDMNEEYKSKGTKKTNDLICQWMRDWKLEVTDAEEKGYTLQDMIDKDSDGILDLETMTMSWFKKGSNEIPFTTYEDLFQTVHITEWIKHNYEWMPAMPGDDKPFHLKYKTTWPLEFNNKAWYDIPGNEINVLSWSKMMTELKTIGRNKEFYANYLNDWRKTTVDIIDLSDYPLVNDLWITFYGTDPKEVRELQEFLENIKSEFSKTPWSTSNNPFEINTFGKLSFTDASGVKTDIDTRLLKFGTVRYKAENRQKLLDYLNDWWKKPVDSIDLSGYPLVKDLWTDLSIVFEDRDTEEVEGLESLLSNIKTTYWSEKWGSGGKPFKVRSSGELSFTDDSGVETIIDTKLSKFKTVWNTNLLKYLNDSTNWMFTP